MNLLAPVSVCGIYNEKVDRLTHDDIPHIVDTETDFNKTHTVLDRLTGVRYKIPSNRPSGGGGGGDTTSDHDLEEIKNQRQLHVREHLNADQGAVFDYVKQHPNDIVVLQAGPGTGKTFTMLTLANHLVETSICPNVVIYKRDLVHAYRFSANGYTVAQFIMRMLNLSFMEYQQLEQQLSKSMSVEHFMNTIVDLIRRLIICTGYDDFRHPLLILDEYTVIPKPFLLIIMITLNRYRIGAVICGDKNQLQNIHNSSHAGRCSAYDIVSTFSKKTFNLSRNERCSDKNYNEKVNFIGTFSNDNLLDDWGYALVSAMFYENITKRIEISDTILARYHRSLTETLDVLVMEKKIPTSEWYIEKSNITSTAEVNGLPMRDSGQFLPNPTVWYYRAITMHTDSNTGLPVKIPKESKKWCPGKYLTFLPLVIGNVYFLELFSERTVCTLEKIEFSTTGKIKQLVVRSVKTKELKKIEKSICTKVMFDKHLAYLLNNGDDTKIGGQGNLYNFPLYPAFSMSIYMSQGRTIADRVSFILTNSTYQCLYVAVSRVTSSKNINTVVIPNSVQHLVSTLLNFNVTDLQPLTIDKIKDTLLYGNYIYYDVPLGANDIIHVALATLTRETIGERVAAREQLKKLVYMNRVQTRVLKPQINQVDDQVATYTTTLPFLLKIKNTLTCLATLNKLESRVWIHEFLNEPESIESMHAGRNSVFSENSDFKNFKLLNNVCDLTVFNAYEQNENSVSFMNKTTKQINLILLNTQQHLKDDWVILDKESTNQQCCECTPTFIHKMVHRERNSEDIIYTLLKEQLLKITNDNLKRNTPTDKEAKTLKRQLNTLNPPPPTTVSFGTSDNENATAYYVKCSRTALAKDT